MTITACRSLYLHVPFCRSLCGYCDFYSVLYEPSAASRLVHAELHELQAAAQRLPLAFQTIFVGGGTPTALAMPDLRRLLQAARALADPASPLEFTVEANPATISDNVAATLADAAVNRLSIGAQSFNPDELRFLGRTHTPAQVAQTVETCRRRGLEHISLDLIFGIPGQTRASWAATLHAALALDPEHLSCYGLTYEPGTPLHEQLQAGRIEPLDPDLEADLYEDTIDILAAAGLPQYEISNYARPGFECRHNLTYWHNEPYLGIGPAAAGYIDGLRYRNVPDIAAYLAAIDATIDATIASEQPSSPRRGAGM